MGETQAVAPPIELLAEDNYDIWKVEAKNFLEKKNLWEYIDNNATKEADVSGSLDESLPAASIKPESADDKPSICKEKDKEAKSELIKLISDVDTLSDVEHCPTSHDVWVKLEKIYNLKGQARKATLLEKLLAFPEMKDEKEIEVTLENFFILVDDLVTIGMEIEKKILISALLRILPPSFDRFKRAVLTSDEWPELKDLIQEILEYSSLEDEERNKEVDDLQEETIPSVKENVQKELTQQQEFMLDKFAADLQNYRDLYANQSFDPLSPDSSLIQCPARNRCGICGDEGHTSTTCLRKISNNTSASGKRSYKCGICDREGHNRTTCPEKSFQDRSTSGTTKRIQTCGICGNEGHNRTTCSSKSANQSLASSSSSPKKTITCGICHREGHNRTTCSLGKSLDNISVSGSTKKPQKCGICGTAGHNSTTCIRKISSDSSGTVKKTITCGLCGNEGHNRTTCSRNSANQSVTSSSSPKRTVTCGICGNEGHNRTTCSRNSPSPSVVVTSTPKRTYTCGLCGGEGHNRSTCSMNTPSRVSYSSSYGGYGGYSPSYSASPASSSSGRRSYHCGNCGGAGHNSRTCSR